MLSGVSSSRMCSSLGTTRVCHLVIGLISRKAIHISSSYTLAHGISHAMICEKMDIGRLVKLVKELSSKTDFDGIK